jgi:hypothetical protein
LARTDKRLLFLDMALAWMRLAGQPEKNGCLDLVYETPPGSDEGHHHSIE